MDRREKALELKRFKQEINLAEFIAKDGYYVDKKKSTKNCIVLKNNSEKLLVGVDKITGHYFYTNLNNPQDKGTIIDYIQNRKNLSLGEVRQTLREYTSTAHLSINTKIPTFIQPIEKSTQNITAIVESFNTVKTNLYLEQRGISKETLNSNRFAGTILTDNMGNTIFPHRDKDGYCGYEIRAENTKLFCSGGTKGLWVSKCYKEDKSLIFLESQIDALSHYQIHKDPYARYITTGGSLSAKQKELIQAAIDKSSKIVERIIIATDNDTAGRKLDKQIRELVPSDIQIKIRSELPPNGAKDWNEALKSQKKSIDRDIERDRC